MRRATSLVHTSEIYNLLNNYVSANNKRGFTIRLKRLRPLAPDFEGPQHFWTKDNFHHFCEQLYLNLCFGSTHVFFTMPLTTDLYRRMSAKDWSEWRWAFSFYGVENWLVSRIMCETKRLNPFFRLHEASELLNEYIMGLWSDDFTAAFFVHFIMTVLVPDMISREFRIK